MADRGWLCAPGRRWRASGPEWSGDARAPRGGYPTVQTLHGRSNPPIFICHLQFVIRVCALDGGRRRRSAHKRGGVAHGAGAARLADMAMDPDALEQSEGEKD